MILQKLNTIQEFLTNILLKNISIRGDLDQLYIQPEKIEIDFEYLKNLNEDFLSTLLFYLFKKSKIAYSKKQ